MTLFEFLDKSWISLFNFYMLYKIFFGVDYLIKFKFLMVNFNCMVLNG